MEAKSQDIGMPERLETEIKIEIDSEDEFCMPTAGIKSEEIENIDVKPLILPEDWDDKRRELIPQSNDDIPLLLRCRLCTIPCTEMVDIFSPTGTRDKIAEKIKHFLCVVVRESDPLPKQVCSLCLQQLELCYRFKESVAEAELQLLAYHRESSGKAETIGRNCNLENRLQSSSSGGTKTNETSTITGGGRSPGAAVSASLKPSSRVSVPARIYCRNDLDKGGSKSSSAEYQLADSSTGGKTFASSCESEVPRITRGRSQVDAKNISNTQRDERFKDRDSLSFLQDAHARNTEAWYNSAVNMETTEDGWNNLDDLETGKKYYSCKYCGKKFSSKSGVDYHHRTHTGKGLHSCNYCGKKFLTKAGVDYHHRTHTGERPFKCSVCEMTFTGYGNLKQHSIIHTERRNYPCSMCDKSFKSADAVERHMLFHTSKTTSQCDYCNKHYKTELDLRSHLNYCANRPEVTESLYKCNYCAKLLKTKGTLACHMKLHTGEGLYTCEYCEKKFSTRANLEYHHRIHTGERPFKCSVCESTFTSSGNLKQHAVIHSEQRNYPCSLCDKSYKSPDAVERHMLVHRNDQTAQCSYCQKHCRNELDLKNHLNYCKKRPGIIEEVHKCIFCSKLLKTKASLTNHVKLHTGEGLHSCDYCGKKFLTKAGVDYHHRTHTGERPFKCAICESTFTSSWNLKQHATIHLKYRHYSCSVCNKSYRSVDGLNRHMSVSHAIKTPW